MEAKNKKIIAIILLVVIVLMVAIVMINQNRKESINNETKIEKNETITNQEQQESNEVQYVNIEGNNIRLPQDLIDDNPPTTVTTPMDTQDKVESSTPTM